MPTQLENEKTKQPETKSYKVTEKAGVYVAGRRSPGAGKTIKLTDEQAASPLRNGEIRDGSAKKPDSKK